MWVTNHPKPIEGFWPRRVCEYTEGPPKATYKHSIEEFEAMGYIGIYVDMDRKDYIKLPLAPNPKKFREYERSNNNRRNARGSQ